MGHGFKAAACVWKARKTNTTKHAAWGPTVAYKQRPKEDAARVAGELLAARDLTPAARAQMAEYLAAVSAMENDKAKALAADKDAAGEAKLAAGAAPAQAPEEVAPAPSAGGGAAAGEQPRVAPSGKSPAMGANVAVLCTEPGMPTLPESVGVA